MKKFSAVVLTIVLLLTISASTFADGSSVQAPISDPEITADMPEVVGGNLEVRTIDELTEEQQEELETAIESLAEEIPEGETVQYLNYVSAAEEYTRYITLDMHNMESLEAKQLVNDEWVEVSVEKNGDVYTVTLAGNINMVSFKLDEETGRPTEQLINGEWENIEDLGNDEGIYTIVVSTSYPASVTIKLDNIENARAMQFINGEWIEVKTVKNPDGTYTITVNGPGFVAILTE